MSLNILISCNNEVVVKSDLNKKPCLHMNKDGKGFAILGADVTGFLAGAKGGLELLAENPTDQQRAAAISIFGTLLGTTASVAMYNKLKEPPPEPDYASVDPICFNSNNPYDYLGSEHYERMYLWVNDFSLISYDPYNSVSDYLIHNNVITALINDTIIEIDDTVYCTLSDFRNGLEEYLLYSDSSFSSNVDYFYSQGYITFAVYSLIKDYMEVYDTISSYSSFKNYSVAVEYDVNNSANYSTEEKIILLGFMSTMRIGTYFWLINE